MRKTEAPWPATLPERCVFAILYVLSWSIRVWPRRVQLAFGAALGEFALLCAGSRRGVVLSNLAIAYPQRDLAERRRMLHQHFHHLGRMMLEYVISFSFRKKDLDRWLIKGDTSPLDDALAEGKGVILLGAHVGPCDFGIVLTALCGYDMVLVGKRTTVHWVTRLLFGMREIHGVGALPEERVAIDIMRALKKNKVVIFVMDQYMGPPEGVASTFFGHPTGTAQGTAVFADRLKVPVVPVMQYRLPNGRMQLVVDPRVDVTGLSQDQMTQKFNDAIETMVRRAPEQWFWVHKRWKPFAGNRVDAYQPEL